MKKNHTMKAAALLLALVMLTSCFVGGTFAKYVTEGTGSDSARVAKWGVTVEALADGIFQNTYATDDETVASVIANSVVSTENVIAPGTSGDIAAGDAITLTGTPEVAARISYELDLELEGWAVPIPVSQGQWVDRNGTWVIHETYNRNEWIDAPLPGEQVRHEAPTEPGSATNNWSCNIATTQNSDGTRVTWGYWYDWVETEGEPVDTYYCPLFFVVGTTPIWTDDYATADEFEAAVEEAFAASIDVAPGTDLSTIEVPRLYWSWPYESIPERGNDEYDTMLGNAEVPATIEYTVTATVTQID